VEHSEHLTYSHYLALDEILSAQRPRSDEHDEMLFIVIHQVYELWFKQLLHELRHLEAQLAAGHGPGALHVLKRVLTILKVAVAQVDVLETMTPRQFTGFRSRLEAASGFQSAQFRILEAVLGRRGPRMAAHYPVDSTERQAIEAATKEPSLYDWFTRFLAGRGFPVPDDAIGRDVTEPAQPNAEMQQVLVDIYAADGVEAQLAERLVDLDEGLQEWRYRHVKMVERTIGDKSGTGGSSGATYLRSTLFTPLFPDLWAVRGRL
jgi:tryptophan 2,3-dioxygenase